MRLIALDFESYFDQDYSLKKLTTEAYVRDPRFKAHMLGFYMPDCMREPDNIPSSLLQPGTFLHSEIQTSAVLCHHAHFDGLILSHHYGLRPAFWFDTLSMARLVLPKLRSHSLEALAAHFGLPAKNVPYNLFRGVRDLPPETYAYVADGSMHDVWLTYQIFLKLLPFVPREELEVIDCTIRMFTEPCLGLDKPRLENFLQAERLKKAKAMLQAGPSIGLEAWTDVYNKMGDAAAALRQYLEAVESGLQSSDKFKTALEALGHSCPMKWSEKQQKEIPALAKNDDGMQELLEHEDGRVQALAAARLGVKSTIDETRAERLLDTSGRGSLPVYLSYAAAKTLRFGGGDKTNWQNFRRGGEIRKSILAPPGHKLVIGDESQIEYRLLCWLTGQRDKLDAMIAGRDLYCEFASKFYGETITKDDKPRRGVGKQSILMGGYGSGKDTQIRTAASGGYGPPVHLSDAEGQMIVDLYRSEHPHVKAFWKWCDSILPILASGAHAEYQQDGQVVLEIDDHRIWFPNDTAIDYTGMRWATNTEIFPGQAPDDQGYSWWEPTRKGWSRMWGSKLTADIVQGLARVVIVEKLVKAAKRFKVALQVHDEVVGVVPAARAEEEAAWLKQEMEVSCAWCPSIPLAAEVIVAERYEK